MGQDYKELLIKEIFSRLPDEMKVQYRTIIDGIQNMKPDFGEICLAFPNNDYTVDIKDVKPIEKS